MPHALARPLRLTFVLQSQGHVRVFEPTLRVLAQRGHSIHLVVDRLLAEGHAAVALIRRLEEEHGITHEPLALPDEDHPRTRLFSALARGVDYLHYLQPRFRAARLRGRARRSAPGPVRALADSRLGRVPAVRSAVDAALRALLAVAPLAPGVTAWLAGRRPELLLLSSVVDSSRQRELVRAGRELGIPTAACVRSWDNLSTKSVFLDPPDLVTVWNETQRREAVELHGLPAERVVATGAQVFDRWFDRAPSQDREAFLLGLGLDPARPMVLYLCSSKFISGTEEPEWVARWMAAVRERPELRDASVLIRPHPKSGGLWAGREAGPGAVVHPPTGSDTDSPAAQDLFFDSLYHCAAVVGINTSALIESAIVGRPVLTVLAPEFRSSQEDSIHFSYLRTVGGGALLVDDSLEAHAERLAGLVSGRLAPPDSTAFVRDFVRPHGLDRPAAPILADAIERAARVPAVPRTHCLARRLAPVMDRLARVVAAREERARRAKRRR